jgi:hypothetical protein
MTALLKIERVTTDDAPDGQCWPPALGDGWHRIRSLPNGRTAWRRVSLATDCTISNITEETSSCTRPSRR